MRVIAGTARSMPLKTVEGLDARPTTDRIKETLFNILQSDITGSRFLDLFSGSGAIGIEALSRGAKEAFFVENAKPQLSCIKDNLKFTKLNDKATVLEMDAVSAINRLSGKGVFDIIFMDAPYKSGLERNVIEALKYSDIVDKYTIIIVEEAIDTSFDYLEEDNQIEVTRIKKYKTNKHVFLRVNK